MQALLDIRIILGGALEARTGTEALLGIRALLEDRVGIADRPTKKTARDLPRDGAAQRHRR